MTTAPVAGFSHWYVTNSGWSGVPKTGASPSLTTPTATWRTHVVGSSGGRVADIRIGAPLSRIPLSRRTRHSPATRRNRRASRASGFGTSSTGNSRRRDGVPRSAPPRIRSSFTWSSNRKSGSRRHPRDHVASKVPRRVVFQELAQESAPPSEVDAVGTSEIVYEPRLALGSRPVKRERFWHPVANDQAWTPRPARSAEDHLLQPHDVREMRGDFECFRCPAGYRILPSTPVEDVERDTREQQSD